MQKNDLFKYNGTIYRVVEVDVGKMLVIDCIKLTMPTWVADTYLEANDILMYRPAYLKYLQKHHQYPQN